VERGPVGDRVGGIVALSALRELLLVRHGESEANVAAAEASASGALRIAVPARDADVQLSPTGVAQAEALGRRLGELTAAAAPQAVWASTYRRARSTAEIALAEAGLDLVPVIDERLRDRELGILDLLTAHGVATRLPAEADRRRRLGKFYYRPPGGESWADVALRLRSVLGDLRRDHEDGRVLIFSHEAIVLLLRYVVEDLTEADLMQLARENTIANCSVTTWRRDGGGLLSIVDFNRVDHLRREGAEPTHEESIDAQPV
jgi:probable phosphoglycerate mutase